MLDVLDEPETEPRVLGKNRGELVTVSAPFDDPDARVRGAPRFRLPLADLTIGKSIDVRGLSRGNISKQVKAYREDGWKFRTRLLDDGAVRITRVA